MHMTTDERMAPPRFSSLLHARAETRQTLRDRFRRRLSLESPPRMVPAGAAALPDEEMLLLLEGLELQSGAFEPGARQRYENARQPDGSEPDWAGVLAEGWIRCVWGRCFTHFDLMAAARRDPTRPALQHWMGTRYEQAPRVVPNLSRTPRRVRGVANRLASGKTELGHLSIVNPPWIAARLWDRNWRTAPSRVAALRVWIDRWRALGCPALTPREAWDGEDANAFREAAFDVLEGDHGLLTWDDIGGVFQRQAARTRGAPDADYASYFDPPPARLLQRAAWLTGRQQEASAHHAMEATSDLAALANFLWADVSADLHAPAPHPIAARLLVVTVERPELLNAFLYRPQARPELLADVLLHPPTAVLVPWTVGRGQPVGGAYDRTLIEREHRTAQVEAFRDAGHVFGWLVGRGECPTADAADLLAWLHDIAPDGFRDGAAEREPLQAVFRDALLGLPSSAIGSMITTLAAVPTAEENWPESFAALLDLAEHQPVTDPALAATIAERYREDIARERPRLRMDRIGVAAAAALLRLPMTPVERAALLRPVDVRARLRAAPAGHNPFTLSDEIGGALRQQIRLLSRAIVGLRAVAPSDLVDALIAAVVAGSEEKPSAGRVAAFKPRFESGAVVALRDRSLAEDLAAALRALEDTDRDRLLAAVLRTDEPMILGRLYPIALPALQGRIAERIATLTPEESAEVWSLTDLQARADTLLAAGLVDAAAAHLEAERDARPLGEIPGRKLSQLQSALRLKLAAGDWDGLMRAEAPEDLKPFETTEARDHLAFYRALAFLLRADTPNPAAAEVIFAELRSRKPQIKAYAQNLFAARVSRLLAGDLFGQVSGASVLEARQLLADHDGLLVGHDTDLADREFNAGHRALLHLALGEPSDALAALAVIPSDPVNPRAVAYQAVALARLGRQSEARAALETAESVAGSRWLFDQARGHIATGAPVVAPAELAAVVDPLRDISAALLHFKNLDPDDQARVLHGPGANLETYLTDQIRFAASSLIRLVSVMKGAVLSDHEDDLNTVLGELLQSRLQLQGWHVPDQSRGGHAIKGPGERDLLVKLDTADLCGIEAVICEATPTRARERKNLQTHFQKLFGYTASRVLYHVTYAFEQDLDAVIGVLKALAASEAPADWRMETLTDLPPRDSRPSGFKALYVVPGDSVSLTFLVLDIGQERPRAAAAQART
jgi:hypothetical protein